jgi:hypothetical protein
MAAVVGKLLPLTYPIYYTTAQLDGKSNRTRFHTYSGEKQEQNLLTLSYLVKYLGKLNRKT